MTTSPCINVCIQKNNKCVGCKRTMYEISNWNKFDEKQKENIIKRISKRK